MKMIQSIALFCLLCMLVATPVIAQIGDGEENVDDPRGIKAITVRVFGGWFSGGTYLDLPHFEAPTYVKDGSDNVYRYDGEVFSDPDLEIETGEFDVRDKYSAPQKNIESGSLVGIQLAFYVNEAFHIDIEGTMASSRSVTSFYNPVTEQRDVLDVDEEFVTYTGGGNLMYDMKAWDLWNGFPSFGFGIGGIINRFSYLEDKTGLYFQLLGAWNQNLGNNFALQLQASCKSFSFSREELQYGEQMIYLNFGLGICKTFDIPMPVDRVFEE